MSEDLPKQEMLAKLLRMTTSPNDGEALVAIRKANSLLTANGWDWDKLLAGKIRIAADPFANLATPQNPQAPGPRVHPQAPPHYQAKPTPPPKPQAPPPPPRPRQPPPPPKPHEPWSHRSTNGQTNNYPGNCYCCGYSVSAKDGKLFIAGQFNKYVADPKKKYIICDTCDHDRNAYIDNRPAPQIKTTRPYVGPAPAASDL